MTRWIVSGNEYGPDGRAYDHMYVEAPTKTAAWVEARRAAQGTRFKPTHIEEDSMEPTQIYAGRREAMTAEIGTLDCYDGAWLVQPVGVGDWDADGFDTIEEARAEIEHLSGVWPSAQICWL
jgi:hypothetical protein